MTVVVFGGLNMDLMLETPVPAGPGETREGTRFYTAPGGKGGNQAVAAARILDGHAPVEMVGLVGDDAYGGELREYLQAAGVGVSGVERTSAASSGIATIFIDAAGENYVNAVYGANALAGAEQARAAVQALAASTDGIDVLLVQQELPLEATAEVMREARALGATVILDPAPARDGAERMLSLASIVTPNEHEASALAAIAVVDIASAQCAARRLRELGAPIVIVTLAAAGVWVEGESVSRQLAAPPVEAVAMVGAGDAFNGGLAAALASGRALLPAVRTGIATGALCTTRPGAQEAMPSRAAVEALLARDW